MNEINNLKPNIIIGDTYEGILTLHSWKDFQSRQGFYGSKDKEEESDGVVKVIIKGRQVDYVKTTTIQQVNAIKFSIENANKVRDSILDALLNELTSLKEIYENLTPQIGCMEDFKSVIGLSTLHIMETDKDDYAYVGFEFGCNWDEEHGLGIMTHKDRVIAIGAADTSFDVWPTCRDNGTIESQTRRWNEMNALIVKKQQNAKKGTSWWRFWN